ncbi:hypothetical protein RRF57_001889 [Xylaria bambusicola]|uniref:Uncharacterized protein n=1 Tax=Xylaria bambusicola TaxID=326684 RepID=A0AAN7UHW6_9PEZI
MRVIGIDLVDDVRIHCENQSFCFTWHAEQIWCSWKGSSKDGRRRLQTSAGVAQLEGGER